MREPDILPVEIGLSTMAFNGRDYLVYHQHAVRGMPLLSDDQWRILVDDSLMMRVVRNPGSYGYSKGLFEISFFNPRNRRVSRIFESEWLDTILGHLTEAEVLEWLSKAEEA